MIFWQKTIQSLETPSWIIWGMGGNTSMAATYKIHIFFTRNRQICEESFYLRFCLKLIWTFKVKTFFHIFYFIQKKFVPNYKFELVICIISTSVFTHQIGKQRLMASNRLCSKIHLKKIYVLNNYSSYIVKYKVWK